MRFIELLEAKPSKFYTQLIRTYDLPADEETIANFEFMEKIKRDCQPFLKQMGNMVFRRALWRGIDIANSDGRIIKTARLEDRNPRDMTQSIHEKLNGFFNEEYGHPYRNGVFATGAAHTAWEYGDLYQIFPIGEFDYIWHENIDDLMGAFANFRDTGSKDFTKWAKERLGNYKQDNLQDAAHSGNEVMLWTKQYYAISADFVESEDLQDAYLNILR